jgi:hypothetical protein
MEFPDDPKTFVKLSSLYGEKIEKKNPRRDSLGSRRGFLPISGRSP